VQRSVTVFIGLQPEEYAQSHKLLDQGENIKRLHVFEETAFEFMRQPKAGDAMLVSEHKYRIQFLATNPTKQKT
jgi:hypothetical protein